MNPETLVTEAPTEFGGHTYTARRSRSRWQIFRDDAFAPVGYLTAIYQPTETLNGWQLTVEDHAGRSIGELSKRAAPGTVPAVDTYRNALVWLLARERGDA